MRINCLVLISTLFVSGCAIEQDPTYYQHQGDQDDEMAEDSFDNGNGGSLCSLYHEGSMQLPVLCVDFYLETGRPPDFIEEPNQDSINPSPESKMNSKINLKEEKSDYISR